MCRFPSYELFCVESSPQYKNKYYIKFQGFFKLFF